MNTRPNLPDADDLVKLKQLLGLLDRLKKAGFVISHAYQDDTHIIEYSKSGWRVAHAILDIEYSIPNLSDTNRFGLWNLFRFAQPLDGNASAATIVARLDNCTNP